MSDPCDNCNKPCCYGCEHANSYEPEHITKERKEYLMNQIHQAEQIIHWLSYQPEVSDSESYLFRRTSAYLQDLRERIK